MLSTGSSITRSVIAREMGPHFEDVRRHHIGELDGRIAEISKTPLTNGKRGGDTPSSIAGRLADDAHVFSLLEKCLIETRSPDDGRAVFMKQLKDYLKAAWASTLSGPALDDRVTQVVDHLMREYSTQTGLAQQRVEGFKQAQALTTPKAIVEASVQNEERLEVTQTRLCRELMNLVTHRTAGTSLKTEKLVAQTLARYSSAEMASGSPFVQMWESYSKSHGKEASVYEVGHVLMRNIAKQLQTDKGYSEEDALRKAYHIVHEIIKLAEPERATKIGVVQGYVKALGPISTDVKLLVELAKGKRLPNVESMPSALSASYKRAIAGATFFENTWNGFSEKVRQGLTPDGRGRYPDLQRVVREVLTSNTGLGEAVVGGYFHIPGMETSWQFHEEFFHRMQELLTSVSTEHYFVHDDEKALKEVNAAYQEFTRRVGTFESVRTEAISKRGDMTGVNADQVMAYATLARVMALASARGIDPSVLESASERRSVESMALHARPESVTAHKDVASVASTHMTPEPTTTARAIPPPPMMVVGGAPRPGISGGPPRPPPPGVVGVVPQAPRALGIASGPPRPPGAPETSGVVVAPPRPMGLGPPKSSGVVTTAVPRPPPPGIPTATSSGGVSDDALASAMAGLRRTVRPDAPAEATEVAAPKKTPMMEEMERKLAARKQRALETPTVVESTASDAVVTEEVETPKVSLRSTTRPSTSPAQPKPLSELEKRLAEAKRRADAGGGGGA